MYTAYFSGKLHGLVMHYTANYAVQALFALFHDEQQFLAAFGEVETRLKEYLFRNRPLVVAAMLRGCAAFSDGAKSRVLGAVVSAATGRQCNANAFDVLLYLRTDSLNEMFCS